MASQVYNVPIIPPELRQEEFILQIADSLEYLEQVTEDVFKNITERVRQTQEKLKLINQRAAVAQAKIDTLKGSKKAIRVFAGAKYPAENILETYKSIFECENELKDIKRRHHEIENKFPAIDENTYKEKLQFYSVNIKTKRDNSRHNEEGLGKLPKSINSVSSLLLYNTGENPYNKYVIMDPLSGAITKTRTNIDEETDNLGDAPSTILQREETERGNVDNYFYMPGLGNVPEIDVPVYLPDLPGVVDDEIYSGDVGESIAPSLLASLPDLPAVEAEGVVDDALDTFLSTQRTENPVELMTDAIVNVPAPPPVLPHAPRLQPLQPLPEYNTRPKNFMQAVESEENGKEVEPLRVSLPSVAEDDGRAGLMESIRNAGGVKLKSTKDRKMKRRKEKESSASAATGGGDLMSDLFNKLSMRRKGISGTKSQSNEGKGNENVSPMDKISAMIPPPETSSRSESHDSADWD